MNSHGVILTAKKDDWEYNPQAKAACWKTWQQSHFSPSVINSKYI